MLGSCAETLRFVERVVNLLVRVAPNSTVSRCTLLRTDHLDKELAPDARFRALSFPSLLRPPPGHKSRRFGRLLS